MEGTVLANRYYLAEEIGSGGMGTVYRAVDLRTGGSVAVKLLHARFARDPAYAARLRREAQLAAALTSPRVVRVTDLDRHDGAPFLVMEYVPGDTLEDVLRSRGRLPLEEALRIALEVAGALDAAHGLGIVHRDLKPENIKLYEEQVKVLDFGIARAEQSSGVTNTGDFIGTPAYAAPERTEVPGDIRADIYALGVMLFRMVEGQLPFRGATAMAVLFQHATAPPPPLSGDVPEKVQRLVRRCLEKEPTARYQTPADLTADLIAARRDLLAVGTSAPSATAPEPSAADRISQTIIPASREVPTKPHANVASIAATPARLQARATVMLGAGVVAVVLLGAALLITWVGHERSTGDSDGAMVEKASPIPVGSIMVDGPPVPVQIANAGLPVRLTFDAAAGQGVAVGFTDVRINGPCCMMAVVVDPDGLTLGQGSGGLGPDGTTFHTGPLPMTGIYSVEIRPESVQHASLTVSLSADVTGTLSPLGPPLTVELRRPGQQARLTFEGQKGLFVNLGMTAVAAGGGGCCAEVRLVGTDGTILARSDSVGLKGGELHTTTPLAETGMYVVVVDPSYARTVILTLTLSHDITDTISVGGPPKAVRIVRPGQRARLIFDGAAGRRVDLAMADMIASGCCASVTVFSPDGTSVAAREGIEAGSRPALDPFVLPSVGAYTILVDPGGMGTFSVTLTLRQP